MKIIFLGLFFCEDSLQEAYKCSKRVLMAPHRFQENLVAGFEVCDGLELSIINIPPTGSFPINYKKLYSKKRIWGKNRVQIGYLNLPIIKHFIQEKKVLKMLKKQIAKDKKINIVIYSPYPPYLKVAKKLKRKNPQISVSVIQTDPIPGRGDFAENMNARTIKKGNRLVKLLRVADNFVLLTKYLAESVEVGERPFEVVECIGDVTQAVCKQNEISKNVCLYAGGVSSAYNICELVDAFALLPQAELWICGGGTAEEYVKEMSQKYSNIRYFGFVSKEKVAELQNECDFLINPRRPTGTYTKYSFPSKTIEYMLTGKPTLVYKLEGIPDEYDEHLIYLKGETADSIAKDLSSVFASDYKVWQEKGLKARTFALENKSNIIQAKKIVDFLKSVE